jgi:DNA-binding CsgD family transcriptional regulator
MRGRSPEGLVGRAQQFPELLERWPLFWFPERAQLFWHLRRGEHAAARSRLLELKSRAIDVGQEEAVSVYAFHLADLETGAGRWEQAAAHAAELSAFADWTPQAQPVALSAEAKLAACLGDVERARELAERGIEHAIQLGSLVFAMENQAALALAAMAVGDAAAAVAAAEHHWQSVATSGLLSPGMVSSLPDYVESLIALGRLDEAEEPLCWLEARSAEQNHPWGLMVSARCRGIAAAAQGDQDRSRGAFATALEPRPGVTLPLEEARTLLAQGVALRRGKHRQAARDSLTRALERFTGLGATAFAERASEELARIGGRRPQFAHELTPSQQRVAELIAKGASNKEIAASLFISEHTVESHLRQIYMKLGVSSRVQLTLHLLRD